ncbi:GlcNAc-transferase family protein [Sphingobacterium kitahiroshimense]|uniref:GlcNAc-transferase family protein n=1 Tax=Sphingobacterium kitahiroshimense TaxID=470446 RepID=A0ABV0BTA3_9SPHI
MSIFVQIAAYRDPLLVSTLKDMLEKAKNPENLHVTICHQYNQEDIYNVELNEFKSNPQFNIIEIPYIESKGLCWARNLIQHQYKDETYMLQIDSHMRFVWEWDSILINMLESLRNKGVQKPILTTYPPHFEPLDFRCDETAPNQIIFREFDKHGVYPIGWPSEIPNWKDLTGPIPARFLAGGFCFSIGSFCKEILDDPNLYFSGEEINLAVRAFTHGYDLYHPHINITWHYYTRKETPKHWDDHFNTGILENQAMRRLKRLFEQSKKNTHYDWGDYGLGNVRNLKDYERYAGLLLSENKVQEYTLMNHPPVNPKIFNNEEEWEKSFYSYVNNFVHIPNNIIEQNEFAEYKFADLKFMCNNKEVHQQVLNEEETLKIKNSEGGHYKLEVNFKCEDLPDSWVLNLHNKHGGNNKRIRGRMPYFQAGLNGFAIKNCINL